jgi:tRNA threonylcarbamoyladenosine biosynthesis protein TsaB
LPAQAEQQKVIRAAAARDTIILVVVLALDTTTRTGSVAIARDDHVLALIEGDATRTHGERLPDEMDAALRCASVGTRDLDLLVVASGPGAFTGLRIGLAAIQGLAMVLDVPVVGVSALDAAAKTARKDLAIEHALVVWMDAQRGEVFSAAYVGGGAASPIAPPVVGLPEDVLADSPFAPDEPLTFIGDGAGKHADVIRRKLGANTTVLAEIPPLAPALAHLGRLAAERGAAGAPHTLQPLYVRRPDAELDRERQARV